MNEYNYCSQENSVKKPSTVFVTVNKHGYVSYNLE